MYNEYRSNYRILKIEPALKKLKLLERTQIIVYQVTSNLVLFTIQNDEMSAA